MRIPINGKSYSKKELAIVQKELDRVLNERTNMNEQTQRQHSPTPWHLKSRPGMKSMIITSADNNVITDLFFSGDLAVGDAIHIVHCVNSHEQLVGLLTKALPFIGHLDCKCSCDRCKLGNSIEQALTSAQKEG